MDPIGLALAPVVVLLAAAVVVVIVCRLLSVPPIVGYLLTGVALGPHALGAVPDSESTRHLAEFGVVFLMFTLGLEFSLPKLVLMRRIVFGLGFAQVLVTVSLAVIVALLLGARWETGFAVGAVLAMSSTAIVTKLLVERMELETPHGQRIIGVLLFQDLAVVPLLILLPALGQPGEALGAAVGLALVKAIVVLGALVWVGPRVMRAWLGLVARRRSNELFVLNVLLLTLGLAFVTGLAGLSFALGAFIAGMLVAETPYRFRVEEDIKPFRDVLLGLFFVTVGMLLDPRAILAQPLVVLGFLAVLVVVKAVIVTALARAFGDGSGVALRAGIGLAQGGEFGFVLLTLIAQNRIADDGLLQALLAAIALSMLLAPLLIPASDRLAMRFSRDEWLQRSLDLHRIAAQSMENERHVILLGYGRNGQRLARLLEAESVRHLALDLDPDRVREAVLAGEAVIFADCTRRESLVAAGVTRAAAVVVTFADVPAAERVLAHVRELAPGVPVIVRAREESDIERLEKAGASEVVPEALESGLVLASHTLVWVGVPVGRVVRMMRRVRDGHYGLLRGLYAGADEADRMLDQAQPRLHAVRLAAGAHAIGRAVADLPFDGLQVELRAIRRPGLPRFAGEPGTRLQEGDVLLLLGSAEAVLAAEQALLGS